MKAKIQKERDMVFVEFFDEKQSETFPLRAVWFSKEEFDALENAFPGWLELK